LHGRPLVGAASPPRVVIVPRGGNRPVDRTPGTGSDHRAHGPRVPWARLASIVTYLEKGPDTHGP
jgi:hypothetical protein